MPTILQTPKGTRCIRCATIIRNSRKVCPSCDLDFSAPAKPSAPSNGNGSSYANAKVKTTSRIASRVGPAVPTNKAGESRAKLRAAKAGAKLCPVCMNSVSESEMTESGGQLICNTCAVSLKNKAARGPTPANASASAASIPAASARSASIAPEPRPVSSSGLPPMGEGELLTAKGMQRQLMSKLTYIKFLIILWGVINILIAVATYNDRGDDSDNANIMSPAAYDRMMKEKIDEDGKKLSDAEVAFASQLYLSAQKQIDSETFKAKVFSAVAMFVGVAFIASFFMMHKNPYQICLIISVLYVLSRILGIALHGIPGPRNIFYTISVLSTLGTGIRTGLRIKHIRERAEAAAGHPVIA